MENSSISSFDINVMAPAPNQVEITFDPNFSGATIATMSVPEGNTILAPIAPERQHYDFVNWVDELDNVFDRFESM